MDSFFNRSFQITRIKNIPVKIHISFILYFLCVLATSGFLTGNAGWVSFLYHFLLNGPILFGTVLIHELGHALTTLKLGGHVSHILLWPLGGLAFVGHDTGHKNDLLIAAAGPLTHIPMGLFWLVLLLVSTHGQFYVHGQLKSHFWAYIFEASMWINVLVMAFNLLLPCYPLDGGRIFANTLLLCKVEAKKAAYITCGFAFPIACLIILWGVFVVLSSGPYGIFTILVGVWIFSSTYQLWDLTRKGFVMHHPLFRESSQRHSDTNPSGVVILTIPAVTGQHACHSV
mmetsp:Transcript_25473/g.33271  ORF Transcript_25473/g.33271 Transcript_25473/m.33271 type:complete len:286 (-) Transcript_25473:130-987(-)